MKQTLCHVILISLVLFPSLIPVILSTEKAIIDQEKHLMAAGKSTDFLASINLYLYSMVNNENLFNYFKLAILRLK